MMVLWGSLGSSSRKRASGKNFVLAGAAERFAVVRGGLFLIDYDPCDARCDWGSAGENREYAYC